MSETLFSVFEWIAVLCNLMFVILIIREKRIGWIWGIIGSGLSIILFVTTKLYSESILYLFYVIMGVYGWISWGKSDNGVKPITEWRVFEHIKLIVLFILISSGLGFLFKAQTDAQLPYADAFSTGFSFLATYLEAKKVLSAWVYWFFLNAFSIWLYQSRGLEVYAVLMLVYSILSVVGYLQWQKSYRQASFG
jgi:nicotinamide mononucleotide transporter